MTDQAGAALGAAADDGGTALMAGAAAGHVDCVGVLLEAKAATEAAAEPLVESARRRHLRAALGRPPGSS